MQWSRSRTLTSQRRTKCDAEPDHISLVSLSWKAAPCNTIFVYFFRDSGSFWLTLCCSWNLSVIPAGADGWPAFCGRWWCAMPWWAKQCFGRMRVVEQYLGGLFDTKVLGFLFYTKAELDAAESFISSWRRQHRPRLWWGLAGILLASSPGRLQRSSRRSDASMRRSAGCDKTLLSITAKCSMWHLHTYIIYIYMCIYIYMYVYIHTIMYIYIYIYIIEYVHNCPYAFAMH